MVLVHLGFMMVLNLTIAGVSPTLRPLRYASCSITGVSISNLTQVTTSHAPTIKEKNIFRNHSDGISSSKHLLASCGK